ncbi:isopentenyl-diphosphate Delta-isomerase [Paeniglutamicibacter psychrophenolicus]|uniref:Isopentenyl-diphosphate Delta-isomerase n=1 Tax=Paeniglutamicibacter psychrophenolicus TaxID=257454 RepID=A0ABS4WB80_9MICC|nr:isopentenyl-diphosphate Delta-isomerase [Paeniglutamicibacter psychrophenolicus]MBP2373420.1 isopentenyl-diphosphate delta-isomerase [Paeniglutamicibacter psychrophenolicus]
MSEELVVLLADDGTRIGTASKALVHTAHTPLHLAFSCYLYDGQGRILMTRRALSKKTWAGVWTNSFCGHPGEGESFEDAIARRAEQELGTTISSIAPLLPDFAYRAVDASGIVENEICPVFSALITSELAPNPDEVAEYAWVDPQALKTAALATPFAFSPWLLEQIGQGSLDGTRP